MKAKTILITLLLLIVTVTTSAHRALGVKQERTLQCIEQTTEYFRQVYGMEIEKPITVLATKNAKDFLYILEKNKIEDAEKLTKRSFAVTCENNNILINSNNLSDKHFAFLLAHEITHLYQFQTYKKPHADYVQLEGQADLIANKITGYHIVIKDHGIPYKTLKTREDFFRKCHNNTNQTLEQIRYYASKQEAFPKE